jgi:hypothetical protein
VGLSSTDLNTIVSATSLAVSVSTSALFTNTVTLSSGAVLFESATAKLKLRSDATGASSSIYFNTGITASSTPATVTLSDAQAYVKIPNSAAGTVTVLAQISGSSSATSTATTTAVLCDQNGTILDSETATVANSTNTPITLTANVTSSVTALYLIDYRTESKGGIDVYSVTVTPSN